MTSSYFHGSVFLITIATITNLLTDFPGGVSTISLLVARIGIMNIMFVSVHEGIP